MASEEFSELIAALRDVLNLVSRNRKLKQDGLAVREFQFAAIRLIAELTPEPKLKPESSRRRAKP
jgi:hypothetical protein